MAKGFIAKILLGLLVASFALWGIGDIFQNKGGGEAAIAQVGDTTIVRSELDQLISVLQRNYPQITPEIANQPQFKLEALNNLINTRLIQMDAQSIGLDFSPDSLAKLIHDDAAFHNEKGEFDRSRFLELLRQNNLNEKTYVQRLKDETGATLIEETLRMGFAPSNLMLSLAYAVDNEEREAKLVFVSKADLAPLAAPKPENLKKLYKQQAMRFTAPEYRSLRYVSFSPDEAWKLLKLDPEASELKAIYEERKATYALPESRDVKQMLFEDEASAKKIHEKLSEGGNWKSIADGIATSLNAVTRSQLPAHVADAVFALKPEEFSAPIKTAFGWNIYYVSKVHEAKTKSFDDAKKRILADYKAEHMETKVADLANQLEDILAAGESLKSALKQLGLESLTIHTTEPLSQEGIGQNGKSASDSALLAAVIKQGFELDEGETSPLQLTEKNDYYLVQLVDITPSRLKNMNEVSNELLSLYNAQTQEKMLKRKAENLSKLLKESENPIAVAAKEKLTLHDSGKLKRMHDTVQNNETLKHKILTSGFVMELFRLKQHEVTTPYPLPSGDYAIGILTDIHAASAPTESALKDLDLQTSQQMGYDILYHYFDFLRERYKVEILAETLLGDASQENAAP